MLSSNPCSKNGNDVTWQLKRETGVTLINWQLDLSIVEFFLWRHEVCQVMIRALIKDRSFFFFFKGEFEYFFKLKKSFAGIHRREKNQRSIYQIARPFSGMNYWSSLYANI